MKIKTGIILLITSLFCSSVLAASYKASREMYKLVSTIKKGSLEKAIAAAHTLSTVKVHDRVVENLLLNLVTDKKVKPAVRPLVIKAYLHMAELSHHSSQATTNLVARIGVVGDPDPVQSALIRMGSKVLPALSSHIKCPRRSRKMKSAQSDSQTIPAPVLVTNTAQKILQKKPDAPEVKPVVKILVKCMRCRQTELALACSNALAVVPAFDKKALYRIRQVLMTHRAYEVKLSVARNLARLYKSNKNIKRLLESGLRSRNPATRLATAIAMYETMEQSAKAKKALTRLSKSKNETYRKKAGLALKKK